MCALKKNDYRIREKLQNIKDILAAIEHYRNNSQPPCSPQIKNAKSHYRNKINTEPANPDLLDLAEKIKKFQFNDKQSKRLRKLMDIYYKNLINTIHSFKKKSKNKIDLQETDRKTPTLLPGRPLKLISMEKQTPLTKSLVERFENLATNRKNIAKTYANREEMGLNEPKRKVLPTSILEVNPLRRVGGKPSVVYSRHIVSKYRPSNKKNYSLNMRDNNMTIVSSASKEKRLNKKNKADYLELYQLPKGHREVGGANKKSTRKSQSAKSKTVQNTEKPSHSLYINNYTNPVDNISEIDDNKLSNVITSKLRKLTYKNKLKKKSNRKGQETSKSIDERLVGGAINEEILHENMPKRKQSFSRKIKTHIDDNLANESVDVGRSSPTSKKRRLRKHKLSAKNKEIQPQQAPAVELKSESSKISKLDSKHQSIYEEVVKEERDYVALMDKYRIKVDKGNSCMSHETLTNNKSIQTKSKRIKSEYVPFQSPPATVLKHILTVRVPNAEPHYIENIPIKYPFISYDKQSEQSHVARQIRMAIAKGGSRDVAKNKYLRSIIQKALCENISWSFIDKFLGRYHYHKEPDYDIHLLQIDLNGVVFILCTVQTKNLSALISALDGVLKMCGAKWKSVVRYFHHCSVIEAIAPYKVDKMGMSVVRELLQRDANELFVTGIEIIDDMSSEVAVKCDPHQVSLLVRELRCKDYEILNADYGFWPKRKVSPKPRESYYYKKLLQHLLELDDVVTIIDNVNA